MRIRLNLLSALLLAAPALLIAQPNTQKTAHPASHSHTKTEPPLPPLTEREKALQILNRFTFGPRPGDLDAVIEMGPDAWFEQQLDPASIPDPVADKRLADYPALNLPPAQLAIDFPINRTVRQTAEGKRPYPRDPMLAGAYEVLVAKYNLKQKEQKEAQAQGSTPAPQPADEPRSAQKKQDQKNKDQAAALVLAEQILGLPKPDRMTAIMKLPVDQRIVLTASVPSAQKNMLVADFTPRERELFYTMAGGPDAARVVDGELQQAKVVRAILSERQLREVMTDFWFNHFNVFLNKETDQIYTPSYERDAIRAHALGKFRDLLLATAQHPAMLVFLDNHTSIGPDSQAAGKQRQKQAQRGLNENYGREVMELHTVGVNGGYSQADVTTLAKILTGWTIDQPQQGGGFIFDPRKHEPGAQKWFGHTVPAGGYEQGEQALAWLAAQPQTAHFISYKLAQRFITDDPPPALVDRMTKTFLTSDGDIKEVLRTMVHSPEFYSAKYYRNKVKTPLEFVASAFRATETNPTNPAALVYVLKTMGEPLYQMQPPTGYPMTADHWMNSAALVDRLNFSLAMANSRLGNMKFDAPHLLAAQLLARPAEAPGAFVHRASISTRAAQSGQEEALSLMEQTLVGGNVSEKTNAVIRKQVAANEEAKPGVDPTQSLNTIAALVLGSPEFQMR